MVAGNRTCSGKTCRIQLSPNVMSRTPYISEPKFLQRLHCPEVVWRAYNAKLLLPEVDEALSAVFNQGPKVGSLAKKLFPKGVEVDSETIDFERPTYG